MKPLVVAMPVLLVTLCGCASTMSGLGGSEALSCKAPEGVICTSVSGVYANAVTLTSKNAPPTKPTTPDSYSANAVALVHNKSPSTFSGVVRTSPRVLRLWIAPWEDGDGDLHEESTVHVLVDNGRWLMEHVRTTPKSRLDAVTPPPTSAGESTPSKPAAEPPVRSETLPLPPATNLNALPR